MPKNEQEIRRVAQEIERYLLSHPKASDSLTGISKWWLARQRYQDALAIVQEALDYLMANGRVASTKISNGTSIYKKL